VIVFLFSILMYLLLTIGSGDIIFWSYEELACGIFISILATLIAKKLLSMISFELSKSKSSMVSLKRACLFIVYLLGPFFFNMAKANIILAYRVITNKIEPAIVKISPQLKTNFGIAMLSNFITLTPGTLSLAIDEEKNIYVHWIYMKHKEPKLYEIFSSPKLIRKVLI